MNKENYLKDMFESIPDYRIILLLIFLMKNDEDLIKEFGFLKSDINRLNSEFKKLLMEQNEEYLHHIKNREESTV